MTMSIEQQERFVVAIERLATAAEKIAENTEPEEYTRSDGKTRTISLISVLHDIDRGIDRLIEVTEGR